MKRSLLLFSVSLAGSIALAGPPMFPEPTPVSDANPKVRQEATIRAPEKLKIERTKDTLSVTVDEQSLKPETIKVGAKMVTGVETRLFVYPEGGKRPTEAMSMSLGGFNIGTSTLNTSHGGIPKPGTKYVVELEMDYFETDIPPQHMWNPHSRFYKVLWSKTLKQTVE